MNVFALPGWTGLGMGFYADDISLLGEDDFLSDGPSLINKD